MKSVYCNDKKSVLLAQIPPEFYEHESFCTRNNIFFLYFLKLCTVALVLFSVTYLRILFNIIPAHVAFFFNTDLKQLNCGYRFGATYLLH